MTPLGAEAAWSCSPASRASAKRRSPGVRVPGAEARRAVLSGSCFEGDWAPAYAPWVQALGAYGESVDPDRLSRLLGSSGPALAELLPGLRAGPRTPPPALPPTEARFRLHDAVARLLSEIAADEPVLLVLDDLHWADHDSLALLRYVARASIQARVLIVGAYREPDVDASGRLGSELLAVLRRETEFLRVGIGGLSAAEVGTYLAGVGAQPVSDELARAICDQTAGNPFFVGELFRQLVEEGRILHGGAGWTASGPLTLDIPAGVREVLARRISRLSVEAREVLGVACAFSGGFDFLLLPALTGLSEAALLDALDELLETGLIQTAGGPRATYDFSHAIVRHTLADKLNPDRRARLHRKIAHALDAASRASGTDTAAELAYQYHASRALPGAEPGIACCLAAAKEAAAASAPESAARFLRMAADLAADAPLGQRTEILCALAEAEGEALRLDEARASVEAALAALEQSGAAPGTVAAFLARVARALKDGGASRSTWESLLERGLAIIAPQRDLTWARLTLLLDRFEVVSRGAVNASRWLGHDPDAVAVARAEGVEDDYARTLEVLDWRSRGETERCWRLHVRGSGRRR